MRATLMMPPTWSCDCDDDAADMVMGLAIDDAADMARRPTLAMGAH
jgi:hypothetical protein